MNNVAECSINPRVYFVRIFLLRIGCAALACVVFALAVNTLRADETRPGDEPPRAGATGTLSERQELIRDRVSRLEDRMFQLAQALRKMEPDKAERLLEGLGRLRDQQLREKISEIVGRLRENRLSDAVGEQRAVMTELQSLLKQLMEDPEHLVERKDEIERLEAIRKALDDLVREQDAELRAAEEARAALRRAAALEAASEKVRSLLDRQREATARTDESRDLSGEARAQAEIRGETESVSRDVENVANAAPDEAGAREAAEGLKRAAEKMESAEKALRAGERSEARDSQKSVESELQKTLEALQEQAAEIRRKLKLEKQAEDQRETAERTAKLSDEMKGKEDGSVENGEGLPGENQEDTPEGQNDSGKQTPGSQGVEQAVPQQRGAADSLEKNDTDKAIEKQEKALENLKKAQEELEDRLEQLRKEQQEEMLAALESRFRAMLSRQLECNKATSRLAELGRANWKRSDELEFPDLSQKQRWVGEQADEALFLLTEEGTTIILPQLIRQVRDDAREVADRLALSDAGDAALAMQADLEAVLRDIIEAIERKQEEMENQGEGGEGNQGNSPLLPGSAELKLLRSCQIRVNKMTERLKSDRANPDAPADEIRDRLNRLSERQAEVADMAKQMHESLRQAQ